MESDAACRMESLRSRHSLENHCFIQCEEIQGKARPQHLLCPEKGAMKPRHAQTMTPESAGQPSTSNNCSKNKLQT